MRDFPVPSTLRGLSSREPGAEIAAARPAATVALLRDRPGSGAGGARGVDVFMFHRSQSMAFAPGMRVFPGGRVDPDDELEAGWLPAETVGQWAQILGMTEARARGVLTASVREVFEETGVLLLSSGAEVPAHLRGPQGLAARRELETGARPFRDWCAEHGLVPDVSGLHVLGRWVTPECEPRRYDTVIVAAELPAGAEADAETSEAITGEWVAPESLIEAYRADPDIMLPPTIWTLEVLAALGSTADLPAAGASAPVPAILPVWQETATGPVMRCEDL